MKVFVITLCLMLSFVTNTSHAQFKIAWADPKHDEKGNLLPLQSYGETINRGMKFILETRHPGPKATRSRLKRARFDLHISSIA